MDLHSFHSLVHTQAMLQARIDQASMPSMMQLRMPGGILDVTPLSAFERMRHSFESGTRHLTIDVQIEGERDVQDNIGFTGFTVARAIETRPVDVPQHKPHIVLVMFENVKHRIGYNPTSREIEIDLHVAWFSSTETWLGGAKRAGARAPPATCPPTLRAPASPHEPHALPPAAAAPPTRARRPLSPRPRLIAHMPNATDPPDDGLEYVFNTHDRTWTRPGAAVGAPRSTNELSRVIDGEPELQFL